MRRLVCLYPRAWRDRYEEEFLALLEERPTAVGDVLDVAFGAVDAWLGVVAVMAVSTPVALGATVRGLRAADSGSRRGSDLLEFLVAPACQVLSAPGHGILH